VPLTEADDDAAPVPPPAPLTEADDEAPPVPPVPLDEDEAPPVDDGGELHAAGVNARRGRKTRQVRTVGPA
jgi:hypothetical protein